MQVLVEASGLSPDDRRALLWSTGAGLATAVGGALAVIRRPEAGLLAFLLGTAIGVMATLSILELLIENALEHGVVPVTACAAAGGLFYVLVEPWLPHFEGGQGKEAPPAEPVARLEPASPRRGDAAEVVQDEADVGGRMTRQKTQRLAAQAATAAAAEARTEVARRDNLLRLGFLMAVTMTLHNLPEGFAVAFSATTELGPVMALAVAVHNIPEGLIVAAPIYAATGSRRQALLTALLSGLSEPLGALLALLFVKPYLNEHRLQLMLAFVGGIMTAVCWVELLPEGRACKRDSALVKGILVGGVIMAATLAYV